MKATVSQDSYEGHQGQQSRTTVKDIYKRDGHKRTQKWLLKKDGKGRGAVSAVGAAGAKALRQGWLLKRQLRSLQGRSRVTLGSGGGKGREGSKVPTAPR